MKFDLGLGLGLGLSCGEESNGDGREIGEGSNGDGREIGEGSKSSDQSGVKRSYDESWGELGLNLDFVGGGKKIRGFELSDDVIEDGVEKSSGIRINGEEVGRNGNLGLRIEEGNENGNLGKSEKLGPDSDGGGGCCDLMADLVSKLEIDLNESVWTSGDGDCGIYFQDFTRKESRVPETKPEVVVISTDDEDDKIVAGRRDDKGKGKAIENGVSQESTQDLDLALGISEMHWAADVISSMAAEIGRRYTREEKGKAKVDESNLSLASDPRLLELFPEGPELNLPVVSQVSGVIRITDDPRPWLDHYRYQEAIRAENAIEFKKTAKRYASQLARASPPPLEKELEIPSTKSSLKLEDFPGPFSSALKSLRERNAKCTGQQLIEWKPLEQQKSKIRNLIVPSLLDLSLRVLAKNSEAIVSLDHVPDWLKQRLTTVLCDTRKMNSHVLNLLMRDSPTEIRVKECSWITDAQASMMFGKLDTQSLRVLQLDLLGQCLIEDILLKSLIQTSNSLMCLRIISLRGACRLSDELLKSLVMSAPQLQSVNVGQTPLLTYEGIKFLADYLASSLRELYIDDCPKLAAMDIMKSLTEFQHLEVLSVAGIESVCDVFVSHVITRCGGNMKELDIANCGKITDVSLEVIGKHCPELQSLNISNLNRLTDFGLLYLANGCRSLRTLKCYRNGFSDDAVAAFVEASGEALTELTLNGVTKVGPSTALSIAKYSRKLSSLDLSWCRRITNEALGLVVDSCLSLKLLKLFGCSQITDIFLRGHSNPLVQIVGENLTPLLEHVKMLESDGVLLRYSHL